jgi:hypothetical protein
MNVMPSYFCDAPYGVSINSATKDIIGSGWLAH